MALSIGGGQWQYDYVECKRGKHDPSNAKNSGLQQYRRSVAYYSYSTLLIVVREFLAVLSHSRDIFLYASLTRFLWSCDRLNPKYSINLYSIPIIFFASYFWQEMVNVSCLAGVLMVMIWVMDLLQIMGMMVVLFIGIRLGCTERLHF